MIEVQARRLYGRRRGRKMRTGRQQLAATMLPQLTVSLPDTGLVDPAGWFSPRPTAVWLEIGFGAGEHLGDQAERHPEIGFIGCEVFENGVARLIGEVARRDLRN